MENHSQIFLRFLTSTNLKKMTIQVTRIKGWFYLPEEENKRLGWRSAWTRNGAPLHCTERIAGVWYYSLTFFFFVFLFFPSLFYFKKIVTISETNAIMNDTYPPNAPTDWIRALRTRVCRGTNWVSARVGRSLAIQAKINK